MIIIGIQTVTYYDQIAVCIQFDRVIEKMLLFPKSNFTIRGFILMISWFHKDGIFTIKIYPLEFHIIVRFFL